jgi:hypothetical protein
VIEAGSAPLYAASGHLLFFRDGVILAAPFDAARLEVTGPVVAVLEDVGLDQYGAPLLSISAAGSLAYTPAGHATKRLAWVSRQGIEQPITDVTRPYKNPRLSPNGRRIVVEVTGADLWIQDIDRSTFTLLTKGDTLGNSFAVWTPRRPECPVPDVDGDSPAGRAPACVRAERVRPVRSVLASVPRTGPRATSLDRGRDASALEPERQRAVLSKREPDDGCGRLDFVESRSVPTTSSLRATIRVRRADRGELRRESRRGTIRHGQGRFGFRAHQPGAQLVRGIEAPGADQLTATARADEVAQAGSRNDVARRYWRRRLTPTRAALASPAISARRNRQPGTRARRAA